MSTERRQIEVSGIVIEIVRKDIKNLHLDVYPPNGRVRVAVPLHLDDEAVRLAVVARLGWIRRHQERFAAQERQSQRAMVTGESHYVLGQRYRLHVIEHDCPSQVAVPAPGAGMADILLVPNYEVGNGIGKAASLFGGAKNAGVILGARVPIVLVSRSDSAYSKLASIAAGSVLSRRMHLS